MSDEGKCPLWSHPCEYVSIVNDVERASEVMEQAKIKVEAQAAEIERQSELARVYRQAQLNAEAKLRREADNAKGWKKRCQHLEEKLAALDPAAIEAKEHLK